MRFEEEKRIEAHRLAKIISEAIPDPYNVDALGIAALAIAIGSLKVSGWSLQEVLSDLEFAWNSNEPG